MRRGTRRSLVLAAAGLWGLVICVPFAIAADPVGRWEPPVARVAYDLPGELTPPLEAVMQIGTRGAIVVVALVLLATSRRRAALAALVGGAAAWLLATTFKALIDRPRPTAAVLERIVRDDVSGAAFPSAHASIATALAVIVAGAFDDVAPVALLAIAIAAATAVARVHLGVHWPLDVVGGAAVGLACGGAARWALERQESHT